MNGKFDKARILDLAERQVKAGRLEEAIAEYNKLLAAGADDVGLNNTVGDLYAQLGRTEQAIKAFQTAASHYESKGYHSQALAVCKKITKLDPENVIIIVRMADLFSSQGFIAEAKREYLRAEQKLRREKRTKELIFLYDKLVKLDRDNASFKLSLADLFRQEGFVEEAVAQLNDAAAVYLGRNEAAEAEKIIQQAQWLKEGDQRTLTNLVEVLRKTNRKKYAIEVISEILKKDEENIHFRVILGALHLEERELDRAEQVLSAVVAEHPLEAKARIKLGKVYALQNMPAKAFLLFSPLLAGLIKKGKDDKAIGLLGIVLSAEHLHLPALEKLATIYKTQNDPERLELVYRVILEEARRRQLSEKMFVALAELLELCPKDEELIREYRSLRRELGFIDEKNGEADMLAASEAEEADIDFLLTKADLYISQGLIRNARRILENLSLRFPHSVKVEEKISSLEKIKIKIQPDEIRDRVGKVQEIETKIEATPELAKTFLSLIQDEEGPGKRVTSADIFADTEILPLPSEEEAQKRYYDLSDKIEEELGLLQKVFAQQMRGDISILEKELGDIVKDFREQVKRKVDAKDFETRFHLGLAYLEQGLFEEAIEEFLLASEDPGRAMECYSIISKAYRDKGDWDEALKWLEESRKRVEDGTDEHFALDYERALILEEKGDRILALELYQKIKDWNPKYRSVRKKVKSLSSS
jgi:tetratricopeptide (TPR) repeat protein